MNEARALMKLAVDVRDLDVLAREDRELDRWIVTDLLKIVADSILTNSNLSYNFRDHDEGRGSSNQSVSLKQGNAMARQNVTQTSGGPRYVDVEIRGRVIPLHQLKKAIRSRGLKQSDLAARTAPYNGGVALHQTSISGYLSGKVEMHDAVIETISDLFSDPELDAMATSAVPAGSSTANQAGAGTGTTNMAAPAAAASAQGGLPSFARTMDTIPTDGTVQREAGTASVQTKPKLIDFPNEMAYRVITMMRQAQKSGEVSTTASFRKLLAWARAYYVLQREGFDYNQALGGAFHLAVEAKTYDEERTFVRTAFQSIFGFDVERPKVSTSRAIKEGTRHPADYLAEPFVREGEHIWFYGPTGSGKSHGARAIAEKLNRPYIRIQGTGDMNVDDLLGGWAAENGTTRFEYGPLPLAMMQGAVLNIDEITSCPPEVLFELQAVLEGLPLVIKKNRGEVVEPKEGFVVVACDNTLGLAENAEYVGTNVMNEAFRDRFYFIEYDYMPEKLEMAALEENIKKYLEDRGWR